MSALGRLMQTVPEVLELFQGGSDSSDTVAKITAFASTARQSLAAVPFGPFDEASAGEPPDFSELGGWVAHPGRAAGSRAVEDANHLTSTEVALPPVGDRPCDCFFVVDSCLTQETAIPFFGEQAIHQWNLALRCKEGTAEHKLSAKVVEQMEMRVAAGASCFNRTCRIYAPKYRQVHLSGLIHLRVLADLTSDPEIEPGLGRPHELHQALELAYGDVRSAFIGFVDDPENAGRPFVLAGHSQGVMHLVRLLQEEVENNPARRARFVHAYLAGFGVPTDVFASTLRWIRPSRSASDVCSVSSWRTAASKHHSFKNLRVATFYAGKGWCLTQGELLTNNPITWSGAPEASSSEPAAHRGALWPAPESVDPRASEGGRIRSGFSLRLGKLSMQSQEPLGVRIGSLVGVECGQVTARVADDGTLRIPHLPSDSLFGLAERDWLLYHDLDCALFHNNLQENVARRVKAWQCQGRKCSL